MRKGETTNASFVKEHSVSVLKLGSYLNAYIVTFVAVNKVLKRHILRVHIEKSSKRREYTCDYCGSLFTNQKELLQHLRSHLRSRPRLENRCNLCPRSFSRSISLKRHVARSHIHRRTVLCHLCGKHMCKFPKKFVNALELIIFFT